MICTVDARPERADVRVGGVIKASRVLAVVLLKSSAILGRLC
jgi:hypothetical protein